MRVMTFMCFSSLSSWNWKRELFICLFFGLFGFVLTAISRHADMDSPVPSICFRPKSFVSGRDFSSLSATLDGG